ncbi:MAG TPA: D-alanine--D-alanine ligase [Atribacteraceae bacterium]|nr:D-alanine--D-alanine ligase [Atribacteraceae bacterium]
MSERKIRVGVVFGGMSAEHEVSVQSARNILKAIDRTRYEPVPVFIDRQGCWSTTLPRNLIEPGTTALSSAQTDSYTSICLTPGQSPGRFLHLFPDSYQLEPVDIVFPVLHGPFGEDGTIQGLLRLAGIPCVGSDVLGSAVSMDKDVMKRLLRCANLPVARFITLRRYELSTLDPGTITEELGLPLFVKPANLGSSVGISKVKEPGELLQAIHEAFRYDQKILLEEYIEGREIEISVLGNDTPIASLPGEIIPRHEFYSYQAKYIDKNGASFVLPARLKPEVQNSIQDLAIHAFRVLECTGMARVDFFLRHQTEILINEINTIPGFTDISMYPRLWEISGISQPELIDRLIRLALERHEKTQKLSINVDRYVHTEEDQP